MNHRESHRTEAPLQITRAPRTRGASVSIPGEPLAPVAIDVLLRPGAALDSIVRMPRPGAWLFAGSVLFAMVSFVALTRVDRAMRRLLELGGPPEAQTRAALVIERDMRAHVFGAPIALAASAAPAAVVLGAVAGFARAATGARTVATIALAAETPLLLGKFVDLEVLWSDGVEVTTELVPLPSRSTTSLAELVAVAPESRTGSAAETLSPFTVWSAGFVAQAARRVLRVRRSVAIAAGVAALGLRLICAALDPTGGGLGG